MPNPESQPNAEHDGFSQAAELQAALSDVQTGEQPKRQSLRERIQSWRADREKPAEAELLEHDVPTTLAERHPDWPPVKLEFLFGAHGTTADFAKLPEKLQDADIYLIESPNYSENYRQMLRDIADPKSSLTADELLAAAPGFIGRSRETTIRSLHRSGKIASSIDLRDEPAEVKLTDKVINSLEQPINFKKTFNRSLDDLTTEIHTRAAVQLQREAIMTGRFETELVRLIQENPKLKEQEDIKVLATMGSLHTTLFHSLRQAGIPTEREFSQKPYVYGWESEAERNYMIGREPSREVLAKALLEQIINPILPETHSEDVTETLLRYQRQTASQFTTDEIEVIYNAMSSKLRSSRGNEIPTDWLSHFINGQLMAKGLEPLPKTMAELQDQLQR